MHLALFIETSGGLEVVAVVIGDGRVTVSYPDVGRDASDAVGGKPNECRGQLMHSLAHDGCRYGMPTQSAMSDDFDLCPDGDVPAQRLGSWQLSPSLQAAEVVCGKWKERKTCVKSAAHTQGASQSTAFNHSPTLSVCLE